MTKIEVFGGTIRTKITHRTVSVNLDKDLKILHTIKPGLYESELYEILDYTNFLPGSGEIPSYTLKVRVVRMFSAVPCDSYSPGLTIIVTCPSVSDVEGVRLGMLVNGA